MCHEMLTWRTFAFLPSQKGYAESAFCGAALGGEGVGLRQVGRGWG